MSTMNSSSKPWTTILPYQTPRLRDHYTIGKKLGQGQFGTTYLATEKSTGIDYACKSIAKRKLICREDYEDVWREIQIMHHLSEHPNVVRIKGTYEDNVFVHLVMELCGGGELFDRIVQKGHYSERQAAKLMKTIVGVVEACHSLGVMHRDLKPENFLFDSPDEDATLKAIDFGLSIFYKPGQYLSDVVGSPYYVAPEVLHKYYGPESDVWSAGVILYILLCGVPPFWAETDSGIFRQILKGKIDFESDPWPQITDSAKDLIRKMLNRSPRDRITAYQVLCHPWIVDDRVAPDKPLDSAVLSRLKQFSAMNKLKKMALRVIAESLSEEEIGGLKQLFKMIDTDNSGTITLEELKQGLKRVGSNLMESEIQVLMNAADTDNSGTIEYGEFLAATLHMNKMEREENLLAAFSFFDKDGSGYITIDELQNACKEFGLGDVQLEEMIKEIDQDNDWIVGSEKANELTISSLNLSSEGSLEDYESSQSQNLQWSQGKAGEDCVHIVVSEEHGWVFVGIYDGFNGPDAPDYLCPICIRLFKKSLTDGRIDYAEFAAMMRKGDGGVGSRTMRGNLNFNLSDAFGVNTDLQNSDVVGATTTNDTETKKDMQN